MVILEFLRSIPDRLGGIWLWSKNRTLYAIYREVWHFIGGATVGGIACAIGAIHPTARHIAIPLFGVALIFMILREEMGDQEHRQGKLKTFCDLMAWLGGFCLLVAVTR